MLIQRFDISVFLYKKRLNCPKHKSAAVLKMALNYGLLLILVQKSIFSLQVTVLPIARLFAFMNNFINMPCLQIFLLPIPTIKIFTE